MEMTTSDLFRILAAAFAFGGIISMMIQPEPSWKGISSGLFGLTMFVGLSAIAWVLPAARGTTKNDKVPNDDLKPVLPAPTRTHELLPSQLPELKKHINRRRWRGKYRTE
ncbi:MULTISPECIES: hypothetical protein [Methylobacterium]|uniref:hypothetical protein n=1 Tax=Methylobacterium TaxID=407 RepID=UPI000A566F78|nr:MULTISPECIES: hypothetical protein [Methylobacterium]MCI9882473.1 hypothetical protein [Methylobacterium goesingense]